MRREDEELLANVEVLSRVMAQIGKPQTSLFVDSVHLRLRQLLKNGDQNRAEVDAAHDIIDQCFECESRQDVEAMSDNGMLPLARRIFLLWKRAPREGET